MDVERDRDGEPGDGADQRQPARSGSIGVAVDHEHQQAGDDRNPDRETQVGQHQTTLSTTHQNRAMNTPRIIANAYRYM